MAGIYLHIPFCRQACHYCNFHFSTSLKHKNDFVAALLKEMKLRKDYIGGERVRTIYFGGGTPSLLEPAELEAIMEGLRIADLGDPRAPGFGPAAAGGDPGTIAPDPEIEVTLEANPDDITLPRLRAWKAAGINRLSIGIQSFFGEDLEWMNRAHNAEQAKDCILLAQGEGFSNISIDLIYGGPTLPDDHWKKNVDTAIGLQIPHLSCYALTVEPKTALDKMIHQHKKQDVDPEDQARQFLQLMDWTGEAGYEHYEISNFARPGHRSRHNSSYWQGKTYLGLGPSAHSYNGVSREWNVANNVQYIAGLSGNAIAGERNASEGQGALIAIGGEKEVLTPVQQLNEYIMISLRTMEGCDLQIVSERFGKESARELGKKAERYINEGKMRSEGRLILTRAGKLLADGIAADLFFE
jgi:oxygen-independent coproporphyrinogen-3 oxidase